MSDAKVTFNEDGDGERWFGFACPTHAGRRCDGLTIRGQQRQVPSWIWDGNRETPTFEPSIDCKGCWHGYIRNGRCLTVNGQDEPEPA